jgi:hypothetical protein
VLSVGNGVARESDVGNESSVFDRLMNPSVGRVEAREKRAKRVKMAVMNANRDSIVKDLHRQRVLLTQTGERSG